MKQIKAIISVVVYSNLWIALSSVALTYNTYLVFNKPADISVLLLVFFSTFSVYNFQRLVKQRINKTAYSVRHSWLKRYDVILTVGVVASSLMALFIFFLTFSLVYFLYLLPFALVSVLYAITLFSKKRALRDLPYVKIFAIAITWGVATVVLPLMNKDVAIEKLLALLFYNSLYILAITIPFDIRDLKADSKGLKTLPQVLGVEVALQLASIILLLCTVVALMFFPLPGQILLPLISIALISKAKFPQTELFYSGKIDGLMLLFPLLNNLAYFSELL